ncbi:MAG: RNA 2'-phosphotransferase [Phycisphaeraceae bacterium]
MDTKVKTVSKSMSYVLRHRPDVIGITLDANGWVGVDELLEAFNDNGKRYTRAILDRAVAENDKQRVEFSDERTRIRARQGHSVQIDLGYDAAVPPDILFHGTASRNIDSVRQNGLQKMNRHHVHLSTNKQTMLAVGQRHGKPIILKIDAKRMYQDGFEFFVTANHVWLVDTVPSAYLDFPHIDSQSRR